MKVAKRETAVLIRLSEREKRTLKRKAANYGMTVSDYARTLLINSDALAALRREADRNNVHLQIDDFDNLDNE